MEKKNTDGFITPDNIEIIRKTFTDVDNSVYKSICKHAGSNDNIVIDIDDVAIQPFIDNYKDMKRAYLTTCDTLLDVLETDLLAAGDRGVLEVNPATLNYADLSKLETKVRTTLKDMYINCHMSYLKGIKLLDNYFLTPLGGKQKNNKTRGRNNNNAGTKKRNMTLN